MSDRRSDQYLRKFRWAASDLLDNGSFGVVTVDGFDGKIVMGTAEKLTWEQASQIAEEHNRQLAVNHQPTPCCVTKEN